MNRFVLTVTAVLVSSGFARADDGKMTQMAIAAAVYQQVCEKPMVSKATFNAMIVAAAKERGGTPNDTVVYVAGQVIEIKDNLRSPEQAKALCDK